VAITDPDTDLDLDNPDPGPYRDSGKKCLGGGMYCRSASSWATVCKRFALCHRTVVCPVCLPVCLPVCDVGALWPNGSMDQDATWYGDRTRSRRHCVRLGPSPPEKGTTALPFTFWPMSTVVKRSPISATAELLFFPVYSSVQQVKLAKSQLFIARCLLT